MYSARNFKVTSCEFKEGHSENESVYYIHEEEPILPWAEVTTHDIHTKKYVPVSLKCYFIFQIGANSQANSG